MIIKKSCCSPISMFLIIAVMALAASTASGQPGGQPSGVELNHAGESKLFWVFDTPESDWQVTGGPGSFVSGNPYGHCGDDYYAIDLARFDHNQEGKPIYPAISGIVYMFDYEKAWGKEAIIYDQDSKFALRYAHLSEYDESLNGKWISATSNTPLGKVGHSGPYGTGSHLHLVLYKNVNSIENGYPVSVSSCSVQNGACVKSATEHAAKFSLIPRANAESSMANPQPTKQPTQVTLTLYVHESDRNGPVIPGAKVTGQDGSGNHFQKTTDSSGYVTITGDRGTWSFTASVDGYVTNPWEQEITDTCDRHAFLQKNSIQQESPTTAQGSDNSVIGKWIGHYEGEVPTKEGIMPVNGDYIMDYYSDGTYKSQPINYNSDGVYSIIEARDYDETGKWVQNGNNIRQFDFEMNLEKWARESGNPYHREGDNEAVSTITGNTMSGTSSYSNKWGSGWSRWSRNREGIEESGNYGGAASNIPSDSASDSVPALIKTGNDLRFKGKYEEAINAYDKAIELDPENADVWLYKGWALIGDAWSFNGQASSVQDKYEESLQAFDKAIDYRPNDDSAFEGKAEALYGQGKYDEAIKAYDRAIEIDPNEPCYWTGKSQALNALGRRSEAEAATSNAQKLGQCRG
jgi:tetratricopeptide (TPR) repeat protein/murein DD-endopeptidase MepM/ murein hydrolase activator NlpD